MDIYNYPLAPPAITYNLLKSLSQAGLKRGKLQSSRLHLPTYRKSTINPMTSEGLKVKDDKLCMIDANLSVCFATVASRKAYQGLPTNSPNSRLPFTAANDDDTAVK